MKTRVAIATLAVVLGTTMNASPSTPVAGGLTRSGQIVRWSGSVRGGTINPLLVASPAPELRCVQPKTCDLYTLNVALGSGYWQRHGDGAVEVAIYWGRYSGVVDLDLQVLDSAGSIVASSVGVDSNAESVFIRNAADGVYTVRVMPSNTFDPSAQDPQAPFSYLGLAQVEFLVTDPRPGVERRPNLISFPPKDFKIASAVNQFPIPENPVMSCYAEETVENRAHPRRCLRFNQTIANVGSGPLELRFDMRGIATPSGTDDLMLQRIYRTDGSYRERRADRYTFHAVHGHIHYVGFGRSFLFPNDGRFGRHTARSAAIRVGNKVGFCVGDIQFLEAFWGKTGNGPRTWAFPSCNVPKDIDPSGPSAWMVQGVDVGWADVYPWNLADQYIDITGVPDGIYELVQVANPTHSVQEESYADNCAATLIRLEGKAVTPLASSASAACPA